jgi:gluconate:H+ symporter, GntP family
MEIVLVFIFSLVFIFLLAFSRRVPIFVVLLSGTVLFGLLSGAGLDATLKAAVTGMGNTFAGFAVIVLSGVVIVRLLSEQGLLEVMVQGVRQRIKNPRIAAGILGYLLAVPITCPIATYWVLAPVLKNVEPEKVRANTLLYMAAIGGIISYILVYPTPVTMPLFTAFASDFSSTVFDAFTIPLSFAIFTLLAGVSGWWYLIRTGTGFQENSPGRTLAELKKPSAGEHIRAWAPFMVIIAAIPAGLVLLGLSHAGIMQFIMLAGLISALALAPEKVRLSGFAEGTKTAGLVLFDICAAGAFGAIVVKSDLGPAVLKLLVPVLPDILIPFLLAAVLATAQGGRVVTAVVTAQILGATPLVATIHPLPLILSVAAGSCIVCHLTDPFFWSIQRTTGDDTRTVIRNYSLPLACIGIAIFIATILAVTFAFPYQEDAVLGLLQ